MSTSTDALKKDEEGKGIGGFLRDTKSEWVKTTFPSSEDVTNTTIIVVISTIFVTLFLYVVDLGWVFLLGQLTRFVNYLAGI